MHVYNSHEKYDLSSLIKKNVKIKLTYLVIETKDLHSLKAFIIKVATVLSFVSSETRIFFSPREIFV